MVGQPIADDGESASVSQSTSQEIVRRARSVDVDSDRVRVMHDVLEISEISQLQLSTLLFTAEVVSVSRMSASDLGGEIETGEVSVLLEQPVEFEGRGDGFVRIGITADDETNEIRRVNVSRQLSAACQREAAGA